MDFEFHGFDEANEFVLKGKVNERRRRHRRGRRK